MRTWRIVLVGFGTVGQGAAARLDAAREEFGQRGCEARIVGVIDPVHGSVILPSGLAPERLLAMVRAGDTLEHYPGVEPISDLGEAMDRVAADVVFEATPTNLQTGGAGLNHVRQALTAGLHVSTTNKGPIALAYPELAALAAERGVQLRAEGTVMSGTPVLNLFEAGLAGAGVRSVRGVLNGTCNFMLGEIEAGRSYDQALTVAQRLGYAETDPSGDVEGHDAAAKVVILANLVLGADIGLGDVQREGITALEPEQVRADAAAGFSWRLVGEARPEGRGWFAAVGPRRLPATDPLAAGTGPANLLVFETEALGDVTITGPGAGRDETGHALVSDLLAIHAGAGG